MIRQSSIDDYMSQASLNPRQWMNINIYPKSKLFYNVDNFILHAMVMNSLVKKFKSKMTYFLAQVLLLLFLLVSFSSTSWQFNLIGLTLVYRSGMPFNQSKTALYQSKDLYQVSHKSACEENDDTKVC